MTEDRYQGIVGYLDSDPDDDFSFLIPLFSNGGAVYRYTADKLFGKITGFVKYVGEEEYLTETFPAVSVEIGSPATYLFRFKYDFYIGKKSEISASLLKLLKREDLNVFDQYSIQTFIGILPNVKTSISKISAKYQEMGLTSKNFYLPKTRKASLNDLKESLLFFSEILNRSGRALNFGILLPLSNPEGYIQFNDLIFTESDLKNWEGELLKDSKKQSDIYNDLINYLLGILYNSATYGDKRRKFAFKYLAETSNPGGRNTIKMIAESAEGTKRSAMDTLINVHRICRQIENSKGSDFGHSAPENGPGEIVDDPRENNRIDCIMFEIMG